VTGYLYTAEPCDETDLDYGVRLIRAGVIVNRLSAAEATELATALLRSTRQSEERRRCDAENAAASLEADIAREAS
jgi:hypothetical protein